MLSLLGVLAISAAASASASAACPGTGAGVALCKGGVAQSGPLAFTSKKKAATVSKLVVTEGPVIECKSAANTGQFEGTTSAIKVGKLVIKFTECKVTNNAASEEKCKVKEPIEANGNTAEGIEGNFPGTNPSLITFKPVSGTIFTKITISGAGCLFNVTGANVVGSQECKNLNPETEKAVHELNCEFAGSALKFGATENKAEFELTEEVELNTKEAFALFRS
jgi:hypothetical protein